MVLDGSAVPRGVLCVQRVIGARFLLASFIAANNYHTRHSCHSKELVSPRQSPYMLIQAKIEFGWLALQSDCCLWLAKVSQLILTAFTLFVL